MSRLQFAVLLCCALTLWARGQSVHAQSTQAVGTSDAEREQASAHFRRGAELFQDGHYRAALVELKRAYEIAPNHRVLYNIGQTHVALGEFVQAIRAYEEYMAEGGASVPADRRAQLEADLEQLRRHTATLLIRVNRAGAVVLVDGQEVGKAVVARGVPVSVGQHRVSARADGGWEGSTDVDVAGGDRKEILLELVAPPVAEPVQAVASAPPPKPKLSKRNKWAIGLLSSAAVLALAGGGVALLARSAYDDYERELEAQPGDPEGIQRTRDRLWRNSLAADATWGAAGLAAVAGAVLLFTNRRQHRETPDEKGLELRVGLAPRAVVAEGRF